MEPKTNEGQEVKRLLTVELSDQQIELLASVTGRKIGNIHIDRLTGASASRLVHGAVAVDMPVMCW